MPELDFHKICLKREKGGGTPYCPYIGIIRPHPTTIRGCGLLLQTEQTWSVCRSVTIVSPAKTDEPIEMQFGMWTQSRGTTVCARLRCGLLSKYCDHLLLLLLLWSPYVIGQTIIFLPC